MPFTEPWSKKHKRVTKASSGGLQFSLSNSYAQPLTHRELVDLTLARGDRTLVQAYNSHSLGYTPNGGSLDLREEIAKLYGPKIGPDNILVFPGAQVALQTAALALTNGHTHSITFTPAYQSTQECPVHAGSQVTLVAREASRGWQVDPAAVRAALRETTNYMVLNEPCECAPILVYFPARARALNEPCECAPILAYFPARARADPPGLVSSLPARPSDNPAGTLMSADVQRELIELANERGMHILCDEVYRLLEHDPADRLPAICDAYERGISCVTLSKPWGGCGVTIGWLAFQDLSIKQRLVDVQYFGTACCARASELQALMVLRSSSRILEKNMAIIRRNMALLSAFVERYAELFEWVRPTAGAIAFVRFKGPLTSSELGEQLARAGIGIKPGYCFVDVVTPAVDYFRVGFGEENFPRSLDALAHFVEQHKRAWTARSRL